MGMKEFRMPETTGGLIASIRKYMRKGGSLNAQVLQDYV
jgi:hypothetical protein